jgi:hypothetical protein
MPNWLRTGPLIVQALAWPIGIGLVFGLLEVPSPDPLKLLPADQCLRSPDHASMPTASSRMTPRAINTAAAEEGKTRRALSDRSARSCS